MLYRSRFPGKQQSLGNTQFNSLVISNPREKIPATECGVSTTFPPYFSIPPGFARRGTCRESLSSGFRGSHGCFQPGPFPAAFPSARASPPHLPGMLPLPAAPGEQRGSPGKLDRELKELSRRHSRGRAAGRVNRGVAMPSSGTDPCAPCRESPKNGL